MSNTEIVYSNKNLIEPTLTTFNGWGYNFVSVRIKQQQNKWVVFGIDSYFILRKITSELDFSMPVLDLEISYIRSQNAMCFGDTKDTLYFCSRDKLYALTDVVTEVVTEICDIRGESFSHMAYKNGYIYVTTNVGIDIYNESLQQHQYTHVPTIRFHRMYGIVPIENVLYIRTDDTLLSIPIHKYGMLSDTHQVLLTGITTGLNTITGLDVLTADVSISTIPNVTPQVEPYLNTLCFSSYVDGVDRLCFYSIHKKLSTVYTAVSSLFTVYDTTLIFYTQMEWKVRGPIQAPTIVTYRRSTNVYTISGNGFEDVLDAFFDNTGVVMNLDDGTITSEIRPKSVSITNGFFMFTYYVPYVSEYTQACMPGDRIQWKGQGLKTIYDVKIGNEYVSIDHKRDDILQVTAPDLPLGTYTVSLFGTTPIETTLTYVSYQVTRLSISSGKKNDQITLFGKGFNLIQRLTFGTLSSNFTRISDTEILATVPDVKGIVNILINNVTGYYPNSIAILFYELAVEDVQPLQGMENDILMVRGTNLMYVNQALFGEIEATIVEKTSTYLRIKVPNSELRYEGIYFNPPTSSFSFEYVPYEVTRISVYNTDGKATFEGKGLMNVNSVRFGSMVAPILNKTYNRITVTIPDNPSFSVTLVTLQSPDYLLSKYPNGQNLLYTYIPKISSVSARNGYKGEKIVVNGIHLHNIKAFYFGQTKSMLSNRTASSFTATVPMGTDKVTLKGEIDLAGFGTVYLTKKIDDSNLEFQYLIHNANCNIKGKKKDNICEKSIYSYPNNQLTKKQTQAAIIKTRTKLTYDNSRTKTIYSIMLSLDYEANLRLLYSIKCLYQRYFDNLLRSNITQQTKQELLDMMTYLISTLTSEMYSFLFEVKQNEPVIYEDVIVDSTYTFFVIQRKLSNFEYFIIKNISTKFSFELLKYYTFDVSDPSNLNTKLSFSLDEFSNIPYRGVSYISTPGTEGAKVILNIYSDIPSLQLYLFNDIKQSPEIQYSWGYSTKSVTVQVTTTPMKEVINFSYINARQYSYLSVYESSGPKYCINDTIDPVVFLEFNQFHYNFTYGTYYLDIPRTYSATLLNKGYEDLISFVGDPTKKITEYVYGTILSNNDKSKLQEGMFDFYYGRVQVTVYKPIPIELSFYSRSFGFMGGMNLLNFKPVLDPVETIDLDEIADVIVPLPYSNTIQKGNFINFNGNDGKKYGVTMGIYLVNIDPSMNIAFLNRGKEELFDILTTPTSIVTGPFKAADNRDYNFYSGRINLVIKGYFESMSVCTRTGYSGGYKLLMYDSYRGPPSSFIYNTHTSIKGLCSYNVINIFDNKTIHFNDDYKDVSEYGLYNGVYTIFNIPYTYPITLLNKGKESLVFLESLSNQTRKGTGPDGIVYTFYYGTLRVSIHGDFGKMSLYTLFNGYMGCRGMFSYHENFSNHVSYPDVRSIPVITPVLPNRTFNDLTAVNSYVPLQILMDGVLPLDVSTPYSRLYTYPVVYNVVTVSTNVLINSEPYGATKKFTMKNGIYIFDSSDYITILNAGNNLIKMIGVLSKSEKSIDGTLYNYFRGNTTAIYVYGNFGLCSLEVLGGPLGNYILCHEDNIPA